MAFLDDQYLLSNPAAEKIHAAVKDLPIIDAHNHANVAEIAANRNYPDPWQLFAATDHYVWEMLRKRGVPEKFITGDAAPRDKWLKMAEVFHQVAGNPVFEWIHLDLRRYLGIDKILGPDTGAEIWDEASAVLAKPEKRPLQLLDEIGVEVMCSTDDPVDFLEEHGQVNQSAGRTLVRPTWRPDSSMNIRKKGWREYMDKLARRFNLKLKSIDDLMEALRLSHDYFDNAGCRASDHGIEAPLPANVAKEKADAVFRAAMDGKNISKDEANAFMGYILAECAELNAAKDWVFQMHIGAVRDIRDSIYNTIGPDAGGDVSNHFIDILPPLKSFLNRFDDRLKVVLYCLDPSHQPTLGTVSRAFGAKVILGSAWWLLDTPVGMRRQLEYICSVDLFANFAGMVSDSRKLLSYGSRFEMFRRVMSDTLGSMVERGQIPPAIATELATRMAYHGPKEFFGI